MRNCGTCSEVIAYESTKAIYAEKVDVSFCDEACLEGFILSVKASVTPLQIARVCEDCCNCTLKEESSMFGSSFTHSCTLDATIDCDDIKDCGNFIYGKPKEESYNYATGKTTIEESIDCSK